MPVDAAPAAAYALGPDIEAAEAPVETAVETEIEVEPDFGNEPLRRPVILAADRDVGRGRRRFGSGLDSRGRRRLRGNR